MVRRSPTILNLNVNLLPFYRAINMHIHDICTPTLTLPFLSIYAIWRYLTRRNSLSAILSFIDTALQLFIIQKNNFGPKFYCPTHFPKKRTEILIHRKGKKEKENKSGYDPSIHPANFQKWVQSDNLQTRKKLTGKIKLDSC